MFRKEDDPKRIETEARRAQRTVQREHTRELNKMHARNRRERKRFLSSSKKDDFEVSVYLGIEQDPTSPMYGNPLIFTYQMSKIDEMLSMINDRIESAPDGEENIEDLENQRFLSEEFGPLVKLYNEKFSQDEAHETKVAIAERAKKALSSHDGNTKKKFVDAKRAFHNARRNRDKTLGELNREEIKSIKRYKRRLAAYKGGIFSPFQGANQIYSEIKGSIAPEVHQGMLPKDLGINMPDGQAPIAPAAAAAQARGQYLRQAIDAGMDATVLGGVAQALNGLDAAGVAAWAAHADRTPAEKAAYKTIQKAETVEAEAIARVLASETAEQYTKRRFDETHLALAKAREERPAHAGWFGSDVSIRNFVGLRPTNRRYDDLKDNKNKAVKEARMDLGSRLFDSVTFARTRARMELGKIVEGRDEKITHTLVEKGTLVTDNLPGTQKAVLDLPEQVDVVATEHPEVVKHRRVVVTRALGAGINRGPV